MLLHLGMQNTRRSFLKRVLRPTKNADGIHAQETAGGVPLVEIKPLPSLHLSAVSRTPYSQHHQYARWHVLTDQESHRRAPWIEQRTSLQNRLGNTERAHG